MAKINPATGKRVDWEEQQAALKAAEREEHQIQQRLQLLKRQQRAMEARTRFMPFIKFTSPDPEDPNDIERSRYKNAKHHDALARVIEEVVEGNIPFLILTMPPRHGKLCAHSTPVLTDAGWKKHGDLRVGDRVFGPDGQPVRVLALSGEAEASLKVTLTNGEEILCHPNHEWTVYDRSRRVWRTVETKWFVGNNRFGRQRALWAGPKGKRGGRAIFQLPDVRGVCFEERQLSLDPYILGVWLGDGSVGKGYITMDPGDLAVRSEIERRGLRATSEWTHSQTGVVTFGFGNGKTGEFGALTGKLNTLGVLHDKRIPEAYLRASYAQRLDLLAGLMDTDGHVEQATGRCRIVTVFPGLRDDIVDLCTTLGFRPYVTSQQPTLSSGGVQGRREVFTIGFQPNKAIPAVLPRRKVTKFAVRRKVSIQSVTPCAPETGRCIQVDRRDGLYLVGRKLTPTHNSEQVSRRLPAWFMGRFPHLHGVVATYNDDFASDFGKDVRGIVKTSQFKQIFPGVSLQRGGSASDRLQTTAGGQWSFVGAGGSLTGRGAHLAIVDDLIKDDKEAQSQAIRDQRWSWFTKVLMSRRMGKKLVIMTFTRWHSDDPIGRLTDPENPHYNEKLAKKIKIINLPAIADDDDPLGRSPGEPLWPDGPDKFDLDFLEEQRALDPLGFEALYQQRPSLLDGDLFKREDIRYYGPGTNVSLPEELRFYCTSDHAVGVKQRNDPSCLLKGGVDRDGNLYLTDCFWKRAKSDIVVEQMLNMGARGNMKPLLWWAENGHISKSIGPFLRKRMLETNSFFAVREITPSADKATRAQSIVGRVASGKVFFPKGASWTEKAINEMMAFPNGLHDDFVDALALFGLGLQSQFGPGKSAKEREPKLPEYGTLDWVKLQDRWQTRQREAKSAGGF